MSEVTTSGEPTVAPVETASAPTAPVPSFGTSRGSGLARGKRAGVSAPAAKETAQGDYKPTAIQVVNHQREYKNPFAPEPAPAPEAPVAVETPVVKTAAETPVVPVVVAEAPKTTASVPEAKPELKILPPEDKPKPAQSWELNTENQPAEPSNRPARSEFRNDRRDREGRGEFRPRERREQNGEQRREQNSEPRREQNFEPRREQRTFEPKPTAAVAQAKKSGFLGWLKGIFSSETKPETPATPNQRPEENNGDFRRQDGNRGGRNFRGGRNRGYRGENRGQSFGGQEGQSQGEQGQGGERRFDNNRGGGRRHHRGGRGRFRGEGRGGEHRPDNGPAS